MILFLAGEGGVIFLILLILVLVIGVLASIRIVPQSYAYVVERIGSYKTTWNDGFHIKLPLVDRIV